jgi:acetate---CoA ligase (ADP-forming)
MRDPSIAARNLRAFFEPRSVAVVGASPDPARGGHRIVRNLLDHFGGQVYAVNPNAAEVLGLATYPTVAAIPGEVDLAVVFIPAAGIPAVVADCVAKGVRAVCIESGGFADAGGDGERLQRGLEALARSSNTRLWGPNCAGYVSTRPPLSTSFVVTPGVKPGNVALVAQSGMMAAALLVQLLSQDMLAVSKACSIGNKCDVDESDLLEYLAGDGDTQVIACYLESVRNGPRFAAALDAAMRQAPVVALMGGRTAGGARAALSHTGSVAGEASIVTGLLRQRGVTQVDDFMELVDLAGTLSILPQRSAGPRVAVLTFSGAAGVVATDLFAGAGLHLADLGPDTLEQLAKLFPPWLEPSNPVDVWSTVELRGLEPTLEGSLSALLDDPGVDAVLLVGLAFEFFASADLARVTRSARTAGKPVVAWIFGEDQHLTIWRRELAASGIPACRSLALAVRTLETLARRGEALDRLEALEIAASSRPGPLDHSPAATDAMTWPDGPVIGESDAKAVLAAHGVPVVPERRATSPGAAEAAARALGLPVAVKLGGRGLAHKTELGGVALRLGGPAAVRRAASRLLETGRTAGVVDAHVLVQPMVEGVELLVGARRDPAFGPLVVVGAGGVDVEALGDVAVRLLPVTADDVRSMLAELRIAVALSGGRGRPPADIDAVVNAVLAVACCLDGAPADVTEIEVNPLMAGPEGKGAVAVDALIVRDTGAVHPGAG